MSIMMKRTEFSERNILKEKNDCTVMALATALEIPYMTAYGMTIASGRKRGKGCYITSICDLIATAKLDNPGRTVKTLIPTIQFGNWIVWIRGHVFAVVGGVIHDIYPEKNLNCHVIVAWRIKP